MVPSWYQLVPSWYPAGASSYQLGTSWVPYLDGAKAKKITGQKNNIFLGDSAVGLGPELKKEPGQPLFMALARAGPSYF